MPLFSSDLGVYVSFVRARKKKVDQGKDAEEEQEGGN
jgi:hypothetical protein